MTFFKWSLGNWRFWAVLVLLVAVIQGFSVSQGNEGILSLGGIFGAFLLNMVIFLVAYNVSTRINPKNKHGKSN